ncbi:MAG: hypothetical protein HYX75_02270 [Acidobacteria bacterium]|nr:hypothetical protein [Acidobacteriota bacterium]
MVCGELIAGDVMARPRIRGLAVDLVFRMSVAVLLLPAGAGALDLTSSPSQYLHEVWKTSDGLPMNSVQAICQSRDGYLWIGTQEGLVRFDGVRFTVFDSSNTAPITNNYFTSLLVDRDGIIWAGTFGGGALRYRNGVLSSLSLEGPSKIGRVRCLYQAGDGSIWIGADGSLTRWRGGSASSLDAEKGLQGETVMCLSEDREGGLWMGTRAGGLKRINPNGLLEVIQLDRPLPAGAVLCLLADRAGRIWIGTGGGGISCYENGHFTNYSMADGLAHDTVRSLCEDRDGNLWIGTNGGLSRFRDGTFTRFEEKDGLGEAVVLSLAEDREGSLWIGTLAAGLHRLRDSVFTRYGRDEGLSHDVILSTYEDRAGNMWIGTTGGGLNKLKDGAIDSYTTKDGLPSDFVLSLWEDRRGQLWIGTTSGLARFVDGRIGRVPLTESDPALPVPALYVDREGALWIGTAGGGLFCYRDGHFTSYGRAEGLTSDSVWSIVEDHEGAIWLGTMGGGLCRMRDGLIATVGAGGALGGDIVFAIHEDSAGTLWVGTNGGLSRIQPEGITSFSTKDGLYSNTIFQILEDGRENLWMTCSKGIFRIGKKELADFANRRSASLACLVYSSVDGLGNAECNGGVQPAGCRDRMGRLWFPTNGGVVMVDPDHLKVNRVVPPVAIEQLVVDQRVLQASAWGSIPPGSRSFQLDYTALSLLVPRKVRFKYMLEGFDRTWTDAGNRRTAYYTGLRPGHYTFRVRASNNDGIWNDVGAQASLTVLPRFFETTLFYCICVVAVLILCWWLHRLRTSQLRARTAVMSERYRVARELHDALLQDVSGVVLELEVVEDLLRSDTEKATELLRRARAVARNSLDEIRHAVWGLRAQGDEKGDLVALLAKMVEQKWNGLSAKVEIRVSGKPRRIPLAIAREIVRIAQESLANSMRHSEAQHIVVGLRFERRQVTLRVRDDGKGFDTARAFAGDKAYGLRGMRERADQVGGSISIQSRPGSGAEITVEVPIERWTRRESIRS